MDLRPLTDAEIANLTDEEAAEYLEHLEALYRDKGRKRFTQFARMVEVPGAPVSGGVKASDFRRELAKERGEILEDDEPDEEEFYPKLLDPAEHHDLIMDVMQDLVEENLRDANGEYADGAMFFAPPGSAKSSYTSMLCPAYFMGKYPNFNVIGASYAQSVANRFSRRARHIAGSKEFCEIFEARLTGDNKAVENWMMTNGSEYRATGIQAAVTSFRADLCLTGDTQVLTQFGPKRLDELCANHVRYRVLSYEGRLRQPVYRRVVAVARRTTDELWRIRTASGQVVRATGNHPFFTSRGWAQAASLAVGDVLLRAMSQAASHHGLQGRGEIAWAPPILQQSVSDYRGEQGAGVQRSYLQWLRQALGQLTATNLLKAVHLGYRQKGQAQAVTTYPPLRGLWEGLQAQDAPSAGAFLLKGLQGLKAFCRGLGGEQSQLATWPRSEQISGGQRSEVQGSQARRIAAGQVLRDLWGSEEPTGPSHRRGQHEQRSSEPRDPLLDVPHETAWRRAFKTAQDTVAVVERIRGSAVVYDIQVEETHCFFANNVLVHNCIIDDPVAGREEADSEIIQEKTVEAYHNDLCSRLKPGGKVGLIMTRWNIQDLGGHILGADWKGQSGFIRGTDGRLWYVVCLPLIAEHKDDPLGRKPGELLWPKWFRMKDAIRLRDNAAKGGSHAKMWESLYQQRPAIAEGAIIKRAYWKKWPKAEPPKVTFVGLFYDTAFEEEELNDPSAMTAWGVFEHTSRKGTGEEYNHQHLILLGAWEEHVEAVDLPDIIGGNKHDDPSKDERIIGHAEIFQPDIIGVEKRASGAMVIQALRRRRLPVHAWLPEGKPGAKGKVPRAWAAALAMESGSVWYMDGPMTQKVIDQCSQFSGEGTAPDHLLDTVTMAILWFRKRHMVQSADEEMGAEEHTEWRKAKIDAARPRRIYGSESKRPRIDDEDTTWERFTDETRQNIRRRLYNG